jgi:hypothetical protein
MKKTVLFVLVIALFGAIVAGCSSSEGGEKKAEAPKAGEAPKGDK